jgi:outer membrane protein
MACKNNLQLLQAEKDLSATEAQYNGSISDLFMPSVNLSGNITYIDPTTVDNSKITLPPIAMYVNPLTPNTVYPVSISAQMVYADNYGTSLSITKLLFSGFRFMNSMKIKKKNYKLAREKLEDMKRQISSATAISFYYLFLLKENIKLTTDLDKNLKDRMNYTRANFNAGMATQYNSIRAEVAYKNNHPVLLKVSNAYLSAKMDFCNSIGIKDYVNTYFSGDLSDCKNIQLQISEAEAIPLALSSDINLKTIDSAIETLKLSREITASTRSPVLSAFFNDKYVYGLENFLAAGRTWFNLWNVGIQISIPLDTLLPVSKTAFNLTEWEQNIKKAELARQQSIDGITLKVRNLIMQIDQTKQAIEGQFETVNQAKLGLEIAGSQYKEGASSLLDVNDAEVAYAQSQVVYQQAMYDYFCSVTQLKRLIGR